MKHRVCSPRSLAYSTTLPILAGLLLLLCSHLCPAASLELAGHFGGLHYGPAVEGAYVFVGQGSEFIAVDASDPNQPVRAGSCMVPEAIFDIVASGPLACALSLSHNSLQFVDISNPALPVWKGSYESSGYNAIFAFSGSMAYVAETQYDAGGVLKIIDVSDPSSPTLRGCCNAGYWASSVSVSGAMAYVISEEGMQIFDVSDPAAPALLSPSVPAGWYPRGDQSLIVSGTLAYVGGYTGLQIVDVSNPAQLVLKGSYAMGLSRVVAVSGSLAYVVDADGLQIIDVSDPAAPVSVGSSPGATIHAVSGSLACVREGGGVRIIDVSDPAAPEPKGSYPVYSFQPEGVAISGALAYAIEPHKLRIFDISDPLAPQFRGVWLLPWGVRDPSSHWDDPFQFFDIAISGSRACVIRNGRLQVIDTSDPLAPVFKGLWTPPLGRRQDPYQYAPPMPFSDVVLSGSLAYVADYEKGLRIIDLSDPDQPRQVGFHSNRNGYSWAVDVSGHLACLMGFMERENSNRIDLLNVRNPSQLRLKGSDRTAGDLCDVALSGSLACVAAGEGGLEIIDVDKPGKRAVVGSYATGGSSAGTVAVSGGVAYVVESSGLKALDISNPAAPVLMASYDDAHNSFQHIAVSGDLVCATDYDRGVFLFRYNP